MPTKTWLRWWWTAVQSQIAVGWNYLEPGRWGYCRLQSATEAIAVLHNRLDTTMLRGDTVHRTDMKNPYSLIAPLCSAIHVVKETGCPFLRTVS